MSGDKDLCFVIMPFSETKDGRTEEYWTKHFEEFLKPLIEENSKLRAERSRELRGSILDQIIKHLVTSKVVVADLTDYNSNVFWELGIRQSFKHGTITIAQEGTKLPFDIGGKATLFYVPEDHIANSKFIKDFKDALEDCLKNPDRPDSDVLTSLGGRGSLFQLFQRKEAICRLKVVLAECDTNLEVIKDIDKTISGNRPTTSKWGLIKQKGNQVSTRRFRTAALERLIVDRYIDESDDFFDFADEYYILINELNNQLPAWDINAEDFEDWFLAESMFNKTQNMIMPFKAKVESALDKLKKSS